MAIQKPTTKAAEADSGSSMKYIVVAAIILIAFFASYRIAQAGSSQTTNNLNAQAGYATTAGYGAAGGTAAPGTAGGSASGGAGGCNMSGSSGGSGGCCGSGASAPASAKAPKTATSDAGVQKISVDVSKGYYDPSTIVLKAGVPAEITFSQSSGCTAQVVSQALNFQADLSAGPQTVKIDNPKPGEYDFYCGMQMVYGKIVVK